MKFSVGCSLSYQVFEPAALLCSLRCIRTAGQSVLSESLTTSRDVEREEIAVGQNENRFTRMEVTVPGNLTVRYAATAETTVCTVPIRDIGFRSVGTLDARVIPYLFASRYAPADRMRTVAAELFGWIEGQYDQAMAIETWLFENIAYQCGASSEQSWALETFENRAGVCRDFAHLGIALCRALSIPARYVTAYAYQLEPQDFHAVFEVYVDGRWYLVDGTRKAPLNGLVRIAVGHDASDAAVATIFGNVLWEDAHVHVALAEDETEAFAPLTRAQLYERAEAIYVA